MHLKQLLTIITCVILFSCGQENGEKNSNIAENTPEENTEVDFRTDDTKEMANILHDLIVNNNPSLNAYSNPGRVNLLAAELNPDPNSRYNAVWFDYCTELMRAGDPEQCIVELEGYFDMSRPLREQINGNDGLLALELMALAYLRIGEQENCQNAHTEYSCILPLMEPGVHQLPKGSTKAIELYELAYDLNPKPYHKWLINLAYMTLGKHPQEVPQKYLIPFPNWEQERKDFPRFKEISMNLGLAQNGLAGGTCIEDFNNDGLLDIFATAFGMDEQARLFINNGKGGFDETTKEAGLTGIIGGLNCIQGDYNNDGYHDIFILRGAWIEDAGKHPNSLLKNNGDGTFSDVTIAAGLLAYYPTQTAAWADYNKDGYLDLFVGHETTDRQSSPCFLYTNNGDGTFSETTKENGLGDVSGFVKGVSWGDIDNDGWPELYVSIYDQANLLFKNNEGHFENIADKAGVSEPVNSFPCWFWDVNNDGYQDIFVSGYDLAYPNVVPDVYAQELENKATTISHPRLYINNKNGTFSERKSQYNLSKAMYPMGCNYGDLDNDGWLDFYLATGCPDYTAVVPNRMFRNVDGKRFEEVTSAGGFGHIQKGHGVAFADIDQDGDQDIYTVMGGAYSADDFTNVLFENPGFENNWIVIELEGTKTNKAAIGTRIELVLDNGEKRYRIVSTGGSFGANSLQQEIGLGDATKIKSLIIHWQNSEPQEFNDIAINQKIRITEESSEYKIENYKHIPFSTENAGGHHHH